MLTPPYASGNLKQSNCVNIIVNFVAVHGNVVQPELRGPRGGPKLLLEALSEEDSSVMQ